MTARPPRVLPTYRPPKHLAVEPSSVSISQREFLKSLWAGEIAEFILLLCLCLRLRQWEPPRLHPSVERRLGKRQFRVLEGFALPIFWLWVVGWQLLRLSVPHAVAPPPHRTSYFDWTRYYFWRTWYSLTVLPLRLETRLQGPVRGEVRIEWRNGKRRAVAYRHPVIPNSARSRFPLHGAPVGVHPHPVYEGFATLAETTTTEALDTTETGVDVAARDLFPQDTWRQFHILVQDTETDKTNREIMKVTAGHGIGAGTFTVQRDSEEIIGDGAPHPSGSFVAQVLTASGLRNAKLNATGWYNVKDQFGALGDNSADDTTKIQNALNAAEATPDGIASGNTLTATLLIPGGTYIVSTLDVPVGASDLTGPDTYGAFITIKGQGHRASVIARKAATNSVLIDASGTIVGTAEPIMLQGFQMEDLAISARGVGSLPLVRCYYAQNHYYTRVEFEGNAGPGVEGVQFQDSLINGCWFNWCAGTTLTSFNGTTTGTESLRLLSKADGNPTTGFGFSPSIPSNNIWVQQCHFTNGNDNGSGNIAISYNIPDGTGGNAGPHRMYFVNNKIENAAMKGDLVKLLGGVGRVKWIYFVNQDFSGYSLGTTGAPVSWVYARGTDNSAIRNALFDDALTAGITHTPIEAEDIGYWTFDGIETQLGTAGGGDTNNAGFIHWVFDNGNGHDFGVVKVNRQPMYSPTLDTPDAAKLSMRPIRMKSGTIGDADFVVPPMHGVMAGDRTNDRFYVKMTSTLWRWTLLRGRVAVRKGADQLLAGIASQSITSLTFPIEANEIWTFRCLLFTMNTASDVGGVKVAVDIPAGATLKALASGPSNALTARTASLLTADNTLSANAFGTLANTAFWVEIEGTVVNGATPGSVQIMAAEGVAGDDITIQTNSMLFADQVA